MANTIPVREHSGNWSLWTRRISIAAGVFAMVVGVATLIGWTFHVPRLMDWNNSGITMKANTSICVMLLGAALVFANYSARFTLPMFVAAGFAGAIAVLTLSQYVFDINLGIDTLLFDEPPGSPATSAPGRMGPPAIISFALLSTALFMTRGTNRTRSAAGWIGVMVLSLSSLPLLGYLYGASQFYSLSRLTGIAFQTAITIAVLSLGLIAAVKEFGVVSLIEANSAGGVMFRRLALPLVLVSLVIGWLRVAGQNLGYYDTAFGTAARTLVEILAAIGLLWWTARGLNRAEDTLREADRRKDEFIATLSHELRNPLAPIRSAVEVLRNTRATAGNHARSRDMIDRQVRHMTRLIDDLLDVGRITQNKVTLRREVMDVRDAVQQALETTRPLFEQNGHRVTADLPAEPIYLDADPVRLTQIVGNLLNNACKFTPPGGEITMSVVGDDETVRLMVTDNGKGIPQDRLPGIFEMFAQLKTEDRSGLGIGLGLTKQLVELHGGKIVAMSDGEDRGSTFTVTLDRLSGAVQPEMKLEPATEEKPASRRKVLVVDDNQDAAESLQIMISLAGNETEIALDGMEALERARKFRPDVILLDIGLPRLDGYEVCRAIRGESWGADTYVVALTGWGQDEDRRRTKEAGFDAHFVKPVDPLSILDMLAADGNARSAE